MKEVYQLLEGVKPQFFGLGFVQCKINEKERIHFYHPSLVPTVNIVEEIHNHRYDFVSKILKGTLNNKMYHFLPGKQTHYKQSESCNETVKIEDNPKELGYISLFSYEIHQGGQTYSLHNSNFHTIETSLCVTHLRRTPYKKEFANAIRPLQAVEVCPFSKKMSEADCWDSIKECLK